MIIILLQLIDVKLYWASSHSPHDTVPAMPFGEDRKRLTVPSSTYMAYLLERTPSPLSERSSSTPMAYRSEWHVKRKFSHSNGSLALAFSSNCPHDTVCILLDFHFILKITCLSTGRLEPILHAVIGKTLQAPEEYFNIS